MSVAAIPAVERIARVLAARRLSANAEGAELSAGTSVDRLWPEFSDDAVAILRALREPDELMVEAGDADVWERMVMAAIGAEVGDRRFQ